MAAPLQIRTPEEAVARIAYLASDVIVSVQAAKAVDSSFSSHLQRFAARGDKGLVAASASGVPEILPIRHNADPLLSVFAPIRSGKLTTVTTTSSILVTSVPHLYRLANYPVVIHVALQPAHYPDYSSITSIRNCGFTFLQSESLQEAQDMALSAHALAIKSGKGVVHFFDAGSSEHDRTISYEQTSTVADILDLNLVRSFQGSRIGGSTIYVDDGRLATLSETPAPLFTSDPAAPVVSASTGALPVPAEASKASSVGSSSESRKSSVDSAPSVSSATTVDSIARIVTSDDIYKIITDIWAQLSSTTKRSYTPFTYTGSSTADSAVFIFGSDVGAFGEVIDAAKAEDVFYKTGIITARLYRPWLGAKLVEVIPRTVKRVAVLEQIRRKTTKWGPLFLDLLTTLKSGSGGIETIVGHQLGYIAPETVQQALRGVFQNLKSDTPIQNLEVGNADGPVESKAYDLEQPKVESAYMRILEQVFGQKLYVANALNSKNAGISATIASNPEFGFGSLLARKEHRTRFIGEATEAAKSKAFVTEAPLKYLSQWVSNASDDKKASEIAPELIARLETDGSAISRQLLANKGLFRKESSWLIGSDAWAYDLGNSGVHHVIASGENVNMLIIDSTPYSEQAAKDAERRKKDIGLYAMNFGNAYVASVAVYSSYTQVLQAMIEADKFNGPSVVLAYLPYHKENDSPLTVLQETKKAVDLGYWPLYRWDPSNEDSFSLDSERIKSELKDFLARENHLTQLMKRTPQFGTLSEDYGSEVRKLQKRKAKDAYNDLLDSLTGAPMTVLYASDNGNAEKLAKRLATRGKARGLKTGVMAMEDFPIEDLAQEENVVFCTSTAGQGEFPQNGHAFWTSLKDYTEDLSQVNFSVMALGDSHYWPRKEDKHYFNKPGKDLDKKLSELGAKRLAEMGSGDDQAPNGYSDGYDLWEPQLWKALGVDKVEGLPEEAPPITNEDIKLASNYLRGTIAEGLQDPTTGAISASDGQLLKFHGSYQEDDRDLRDERKAQGLEPAYSFMIRCRLAGGVATPRQWIQMDDISTQYGNETMKLTTRQTFQFHMILKKNLKFAMRAINKALMTTIAACGDVNRNVMCSSMPTKSKFHAEAMAVAHAIDQHLLPATNAYHEIWLMDDDAKKTLVSGNAVQDHEPLYTEKYLPRKFKITMSTPPNNDTDVFAHDIGLIAIKDEKTGGLAGVNVCVGGGMGVTHGNKKTYPRTGSIIGFVVPEQAHIVCEKIMLVQRDEGNRKDRKNARLKYTVDRLGVDVFKGMVEERWGQKFEPARKFHFDSNIDAELGKGWQKDEDGLNHFTMFIENGRVEDVASAPQKSGLRELATYLDSHKVGQFRLTGNQHLIVSEVPDEHLDAAKEIMKRNKLDKTELSGLRASSSSCVALPTCALAMAEAERYLPEFIGKLEPYLEEIGLGKESIVLRNTGCPNGCARPWLAEIALVGKAPGTYNLLLGGGYHGQRLNKLYRASVKEEEILEILKPMFKSYAETKNEGEHFGDWTIRTGIIAETTAGLNFYENTGEDEEEE